MNQYECITTVLATGTLLTGIGTIALAIITNQNNKKIAERQRQTDINIAKRQGVIDLHNAWNDIKTINPNDLIGPDVVYGINALSLTASLWNNDIMEKNVLFQSYWANYKTLYDTLHSLDVLAPGLSVTCKNLLTSDIRSVYKEMEQMEFNNVVKTTM